MNTHTKDEGLLEKEKDIGLEGILVEKYTD